MYYQTKHQNQQNQTGHLENGTFPKRSSAIAWIHIENFKLL